MKITICGSMAFAKDMLEAKQQLEAQKNEVIVPANIEHHADGSMKMENKDEKIQIDAIRMYFEKIKNTDSILVINKEKNGIPNYIGGNGLIEMAFAYVLNKKIFLLNPIPQMSYTDEIEAMMPIALNQDFSKIK